MKMGTVSSQGNWKVSITSTPALAKCKNNPSNILHKCASNSCILCCAPMSVAQIFFPIFS